MGANASRESGQGATNAANRSQSSDNSVEGNRNNNNNNNRTQSPTPGMENVYSQHSINQKYGSNYSIHNDLTQENLQMQQSASNYSNEPIRPELLIAEINGEIAENDYFARALKILQNIQIEDVQVGKAEDALELDDAYLLAEPGYLSLENGIVRKSDGSLYIAVFVDLGYDVNGDMFDWWFCNCDNDEKYRWIHPVNHHTGTWDPAYYSMMNFERLKGHYIDHLHITQQSLPAFTSSGSTMTSVPASAAAASASSSSPVAGGGALALVPSSAYSLQTEFIRPSKFFDITKFESQNITACLVGKINLKDSFLQTYLHIGYVFYLIREINGHSELRIRYFLGDSFYYPMENHENYYYSQFIQLMTNNYFFRWMKLSLGLGKSIYKNTLEEMLCLKEILPHYYQTTLQQQREFQLNYSFTN